LHTAIRLRLEAAHAAVEVALIEARRRVRLWTKVENGRAHESNREPA
jgi:hypothetical protein